MLLLYFTKTFKKKNDSTNGMKEDASSLKKCIIELSEEYCSHISEPFCTIIEECRHDNFQMEKCRPQKCPFSNDGCIILSYCAAPHVIEYFTY